MDWLIYIFYGFLTGLSEMLPVSNEAHDYFWRLMTHFDPNQPLLRFCIHAACLGALLVLCRHRASHIYREMRIASQPPRHRKRQPDILAVLDGKVILTIFLPVGACLFLSIFLGSYFNSLPFVILFLLVSGTLLYIPHFLPTANRDSRHLSRLEALGFGLFAGLSVIPGFSRIGGLLSIASIRGCSRNYILDITFLLLIPLLMLLSILDLLAMFTAGFFSITIIYLLQCILAGTAAFGGACLAIAALRFVSVNLGYTIFAYYNWGLGIFGFILYLMI